MIGYKTIMLWKSVICSIFHALWFDMLHVQKKINCDLILPVCTHPNHSRISHSFLSLDQLEGIFRSASVVEIDHKVFSTVILLILLIQEGQLLVSGN